MSLNDKNDECRKCGRETQSLFGSGLSRYCPYCEGGKDDPEKTNPRIDLSELELEIQELENQIQSDPNDPYGWIAYDPNPKNLSPSSKTKKDDKNE